MDKDLHFIFKSIPTANEPRFSATEKEENLPDMDLSFQQEISLLKKLTFSPSDEVIRHLMQTISEAHVEI